MITNPYDSDTYSGHRKTQRCTQDGDLRAIPLSENGTGQQMRPGPKQFKLINGGFTMKKLFLVILLVIMASAMALAQVTKGTETSSGAGNAKAPTVDVLGAHNNYGRGCAG